MTQIETLELIGNQLLNLSYEINNMINNEDYQGIENQLEHKESLFRKFVTAKKTTTLSEEQTQKIKLLEDKIKEQEQANIKLLQEMRHSGENELKNTKDKIKINAAYEIQTEEGQGQYFDVIE